jgi:DNA polymerase (family X)
MRERESCSTGGDYSSLKVFQSRSSRFILERMSHILNDDIAGRLEEVARILAEQGANRFRVQAYHRAADALRVLPRPVSEIFAEKGLAGLEELPSVGESIARSIRDILVQGKLVMLDRLRGEHDPVALLTSVPGIGNAFARKLHDDLHIETLEDLEAAAHDGRLENVAGFGAKRLAGVRDSLAHRLGRIRKQPPATETPAAPAIAELLDVDAEYRRSAEEGRLKMIAPRRFNPAREAWLPVLHTTRGARHYTALFSNTARSHELGKTHDWVVLYFDGRGAEQQCTVITSEFGALKGMRIVRGREDECAEHYRRLGTLPPKMSARERRKN